MFRKGLNHELQAELACRDDGKDFDQFIELTILTISSVPEDLHIAIQHVPHLPLLLKIKLCKFTGAV